MGKRRKRTGKKRRASTSFLKGANAWREHLAKYRKDHPGVHLKDQMKGASKTFKKLKKSTSIQNDRYSVRIRPKNTRKSKNRRTKRGKAKQTKKTNFLGF
jgi:hypothetical protein